MAGTRYYPNFMFVSTRDWATKNRESVLSFRKSLDEAMAISNSSPDKAREAFGSFVKLPPEVLARTNIIKYRIGAGEDTLGQWVGILENQGMLKNKIDPNRLLFK
jgi:NitT/TauT family transport system substrate-binding protein